MRSRLDEVVRIFVVIHSLDTHRILPTGDYVRRLSSNVALNHLPELRGNPCHDMLPCTVHSPHTPLPRSPHFSASTTLDEPAAKLRSSLAGG